MPLPADGKLSRKVFDSVSCGITIADATDPELPLIYVNPAFERMTGYSADEVYGRNCRFLQGGDTDQPDLEKIRTALRERLDQRVLLKNYRKDGTLFWNELYLSPMFNDAKRLTHFVGIQNDVTAQVEATQRLEHLAFHDPLTGLANRKLLMRQLKQAIERARRSGVCVIVLFFDLDQFKQVNDRLGHEAGDTLLQVVAERLMTVTRVGETVARLGGDEFVVVLECPTGDWKPEEVTQRLTARVCEPMKLLEETFRPSVSLGIACFPGDGDTAEALLKVADLNMYAAKHGRVETAQKKPVVG